MKSEYGRSKTGTNDKKTIMMGLFSSEKFWQRQGSTRGMKSSAQAQKKSETNVTNKRIKCQIKGRKRKVGLPLVCVWMPLEGSHADMWIQVHKEDGRKPFG